MVVPKVIPGSFGWGYCVLLERGNLWVPIIAPSRLNNGGQVLLAYLHEHGEIKFDITSDESVPLRMLCWISTAACIGLLFLLNKPVTGGNLFIERAASIRE